MAVYDKFAAHYDKAFAPLERIGLTDYRKEALSLLPENASILELGAGTGANFAFYPTSKLAVSTELSLEMARKAKVKVGSNVLVNADAQYLPFNENEFDAAFATLVFCSIPDPAKAFGELRRVVKPGGKVILLEHVRPRGLLGHFFDALNYASVRLAEDHFNRETATIAKDAGLYVDEVRSKMASIVNLIVCTVPEQ